MVQYLRNTPGLMANGEAYYISRKFVMKYILENFVSSVSIMKAVHII